MIRVFVAALLGLASVSEQAPVTHELAGGGSVSLRREGDRLLVVVVGPRAGLASLCLGDDSRVRVLHASAAVGEATYERSGAGWALTEGFDFKLRETRSGPPPDTERLEFFNATGWLANASNAGTAAREFAIRVDARARFLGVTFFTTMGQEAISHWPAAMNDDCRAVKVAQGFLPKAAQFQPSTWYRVP